MYEFYKVKSIKLKLETKSQRVKVHNLVVGKELESSLKRYPEVYKV